MSTKLAKIIADFRTSLATKLSAGASTCTLQSATDDDGVALPSGTYFFTIDGDNSQKEHIVATLSGTSLTAISSISRQGTQTANAVREHRVGASVTITNFAHIKYINDLLDGTTNLNASTPLTYDGTASITTANQLATKAYVDGVTTAGAPDASTTVKGITKLSVAPVSATIPIAVGQNDPKVPTIDMSTFSSNYLAAMGGTSGAPSGSNKYVTDADTLATTSASKVIRFNSSGLINAGILTSGFGGTGADGAKTISASENLDAASANYVVKNYTSLTINAGQTWTLINRGTTYGTLVHIKITGNLIVNGTINFSGATSGFKGGAFCLVNPNGENGTAGSPASMSSKSGNGGNGGASYASVGTTGGTGTGNTTQVANHSSKLPFYAATDLNIKYLPGKTLLAFCGGSGGTGGSVAGGTGGGVGGDGGAGLIIEVIGTVTFGASSVINLSGGAGGTGGTGDGSFGEGGGGGGGGGIGVIVYNGALTDSGLTKTVTGGSGGAGGGTGGAGGAGAAGRINLISNKDLI